MGNQLKGKRTVAMLLSIAIVFFAIFVHIPTVYAASKAALAKKSGSVVIGGTQNIRVKNVPKGAKITYKSRKASVAVVSKKGKVTGVKAGTADISVIVKKRK